MGRLRRAGRAGAAGGIGSALPPPPTRSPGSPEPRGNGRAWSAYGASPLHLVAVTGGFIISGYAASRLIGVSGAGTIVIWFVLAAVAHDLVLLPLYSALAAPFDRRSPSAKDTAPAEAASPTKGPSEGSRPQLWWSNYLRVPGGLSLLLLLVYLPLIARLGAPTYRSITGLSPNLYFDHWLWITGILFALSALALVARLGSVGKLLGRHSQDFSRGTREDALRPPK